MKKEKNVQNIIQSKANTTIAYSVRQETTPILTLQLWDPYRE